MSNKTDKWIEENKDQMVKDLQKLLSYKSIEGKEDGNMPFGRDVYDCLLKALSIGEGFGFKSKNLDGYCGVLEEGNGEETLGILGHLDVVPEGDGWSYPPYSGEIHDGRLYGRGTIDDKGPTLASMYALAAVKNSGYEFKRKVKIILGCNEETDMKCVEYFLKKEGAPNLTFTPDGAFPLSCSEKSILHITYKKEYDSNIKMNVGYAANIVPGAAKATAFGKEYFAKGIQAHAAMPWTGKNAIQMMFELLAKENFSGEDGKVLNGLNDLLKNEYYGEGFGLDFEDESGRQTLNVGIVNWDEKGFSLTYDLRCPTSKTEKEILKALDSKMDVLGAKRESYSFSKGYSIGEDCELVTKLLTVYQNRTKDLDAKPMHMGGGTYARHIPNAVSFGPEGWLCEADCHVANEFISLEQFEFLTKIYADAIISLAC